MTDFSIQQIINESLQAEQAEWKPKTQNWQASDTGKCLRTRFYKRLAIPYTKPFDDRTLRVFAMGNIVHWWFQRKLADLGVLIAKEAEVWSDDCSVIGHFDALVENEGQYILYDFKSKHSFGFTYLAQDGAQSDHKAQVTLYKMLLEQNGYATMEKESDLVEGGADEWVCVNYPPVKVASARILYISKDDLRCMEFDGQTDENAIREEYRQLNEYWKKQELPPCTCDQMYISKKTGESNGHKYCNYNNGNSCCSEELFKKMEEV